MELESREYELGGKFILRLRKQLDNLEYDAMQEKPESLSA
jgi:hypothetical protein